MAAASSRLCVGRRGFPVCLREGSDSYRGRMAVHSQVQVRVPIRGSALVQGVVERRIQEWSGASQLQTKLVVSEKACRTSSAYGILVRGSLVTGRQERSRKRGSDRTCVARSPGFHHESRQPAPISHPCRRRAQSPASAASRICSEIKARMIT